MVELNDLADGLALLLLVFTALLVVVAGALHQFFVLGILLTCSVDGLVVDFGHDSVALMMMVEKRGEDPLRETRTHHGLPL